MEFKKGDKIRLKSHSKRDYYTSEVGAIGTAIRDSEIRTVTINNVTGAEPHKIKTWYIEDVELVIEKQKNKLFNYNHY